MSPRDNWSEYEKMVLDRLDRLEKQHEVLVEKMDRVRLDLHLIKFKMGMYGGIGAAIVVLGKHLIDKL